MSAAIANLHRQTKVFQQGAHVGSTLEEALLTAIANDRHVPFDTRLRADCFLFGALCAKASVAAPEWLNGAPIWAQGAVLEGHAAFLAERASWLDAVPASIEPRPAVAPAMAL